MKAAFVSVALATVLATMGVAGQAGAATLTHAYDFATSSSGQIFDSVGSADGTLIGGATVSGGALQLNGAADGVDFSAFLLPSGVYDFSVYLRVQGTPNPGTYTEIISQNSSGAPGFYIGTAPGGGFRLGDQNFAVPAVFPSGPNFHDLLLTSGSGGLRFSIDGVQVYSGGQMSIGSGGDFTRVGRQFNAHGENFDGQIDTLKIFRGVATQADLSGTVPEPGAWVLMILGMGGVGASLRRLRRTAFAA